jgi:hypothetical protein
MSRRLGDIPEHRLMSDEYRRIEVITGTARRRRWSVEEKLRILGESCEPGESVSVVARRNGVAPNLLYHWRRLMHQGGAAAVGSDERVPTQLFHGYGEFVADLYQGLDGVRLDA